MTNNFDTVAAPTAPATTEPTPIRATQESVAQSAIDQFLSAGKARTKLSKAQRVYPLAHFGGWAPAKQGKTDLGLRARTSEVRSAPKTVAGSFDVIQGELLIPSKPLTIIYANFDRDNSTVLVNLPDDVEIIEEKFYEDEDGSPIVAPDKGTIQKQLIRLNKLMTDADGKFDLFMLDGATPAWDQVRDSAMFGLSMAGKTPEGEERFLPRQYTPANNQMRASVMQRLYGLQMHTYLTNESAPVWTGQNAPAVGADGNTLLRRDGWNKTGHYVDYEFRVFTRARPESEPIRGVVGDEVCVNARLLGVELLKATFASIYAKTFGLPLLKKEDRELFEKLEREHGPLSWA